MESARGVQQERNGDDHVAAVTNETAAVRRDAGRWSCRNGLGSVITRGAGRPPVAAAARASDRRGVHGAARDPERLARHGQHPAERRSHSRRVDQARCDRPPGLGARREPDRVWRDPNSGSHAHDWLLCALRRPAAGSEGMDDAAVYADAAQQGNRGGRHRDPAAGRGNALRSRVAHLRPRRRRRQGADHRAVGGPRRDPRRRARAQVEHQVHVRRGRGSRVPEPDARSWKRTGRSLPPTSG